MHMNWGRFIKDLDVELMTANERRSLMPMVFLVYRMATEALNGI